MSVQEAPATELAGSTLHTIGESSPAFPGWRVLLGAVIGLAFSPGPMVFGSMGLIAPFLEAGHGWTRAQVMLCLTLFNLSGILTAPWTGRLIDRHGARAVLLPSIALLSIGFAALAFLSGSLWSFYAVAFVWGGVTVGTQSISYTKLIGGWFDRHRGLAIGIAAAGLGLGYMLVPLILARLLANMSWQAAYATLGLIVVAGPLLVNAVVARANPQASAMHDEGTGLTLHEAVRTRAFALMAAVILLASIALTGVVPHIALLALDRGFAREDAAVAASVYGLSTVIGRVLVGWLADRYPVTRVGALFFALSLIGFLLAGGLGGTASLPLLVFLALVIGLGFGAESDIIALLIIRFFGRRSFGAIYGWLLSAFLIGASIGSPLFGLGHDWLGSYQAAMFGAALIMATVIVMMLRLGRLHGASLIEGR